MTFNHIGIAVSSISVAIQDWRKLGPLWLSGKKVEDKSQHVTLQLVTACGTPIEFISGPGVASILSRGGGAYHLCYEVSNLDDTIARLVAGGWCVIKGKTSAPLFGNRHVVFLMKNNLIIELLEGK